MTTTKYLLEELNAIQVKDKINQKTIVFIVLGACENHGSHMPFGADFIFPMKLIQIIIEDLLKINNNIIVLPAVPYGLSSHHNNFQMTISLEPNTMILILENIMQSVVKNGVNKIIILNGHDGNISPIEIASRKIKNDYPEVILACLESWWVTVGQKDKSLFKTWDGLGHGGEAETSAMLYVRPDLVDINNISNPIIPNLPKDNIRLYWKFNELTDTGYTGDPRIASSQKGEKVIKILKNIIIEFLIAMEKSEWKYGKSTEIKF
ncbi:MAG TPA: creatininase family protein [Verrucomicrobiae bacterium]|nr:creatininase family protein [Verrucomicrobiae bacterium]